MMDIKQNRRMTLASAMWRVLSNAAAWLKESDATEEDPFLDPVFRSMSPRELADLPLTRWPAEKEASPAQTPERLKKMPERTASSAPGLPKDGWMFSRQNAGRRPRSN
ncbi:hypothetical protein M2360_000363 [Rhizobium sp. SG_E_25_P2]|nr:hypothetical protein [Rhizobium sp. SG_E_25_P2]